MAKTVDYKLWPALEGLGSLKYRPVEDLNDLYEDLFSQAMKRNGNLIKSDAEAYIVLQDWAFGKLTKKEAYNKLDKLDYIEWEVV